MATVFDTYIDHLCGADVDWPSVDVRGALFDASAGPWVPDKSDAFVATPIAAGAVEMAAGSYARVPLSGQVKTIDGGGHRVLLTTDSIDFGNLETGFAFDTLVLFVFVTNDADSWLVVAFDLGAQATDGTQVLFVLDADGLFALAQP